MNDPSRPLFLAREPYRARRTMDAARLLPVLGVLLLVVLLPLIREAGFTHEIPLVGGDPIAEAATEEKFQTHAGANIIYMFLVWIGLIAAAALLAVRLSRIDPSNLPGNLAARDTASVDEPE